MKTILKTSLIAIALLLGISANAQEKPLTFGVKAGMNISNFSGDGDSDSKFGFNAGVTVDYALSSDLYLLSGLELTTKGAKDEVSATVSGIYAKTKFTATPMYLQLPVHVGYKLTVTEATKIVFHAGPYIAYGIGGKVKTEVSTNASGKDVSDENKEDFFGDEGAKRFDFGVGLGAGVEFGKIGVGLGYDFGLTKLYDEGNNKNMNAYLTVGYKF